MEAGDVTVIIYIFVPVSSSVLLFPTLLEKFFLETELCKRISYKADLILMVVFV